VPTYATMATYRTATWTYWAVNNGYAYTHDGLNRLLLAASKQGSSQGDGYFNEKFSYDSQGNILTLQRNKDNALIDDLSMNYTGGGNQVQSITDGAGLQNQYATKEYNDKSDTGNEFGYDKNGSMTKDKVQFKVFICLCFSFVGSIILLFLISLNEKEYPSYNSNEKSAF